MNYKISILSPVHIFSGNLNPCYLYHYDQGFMDCYDIEELFKQVPPNELMKIRFSDANDGSKRYISRYFKNKINYQTVQSQYYLESMIDECTKDVQEQMKSMNRPYIPGSSLKGAFMNMIVYHLLKDRKNDVGEFIKQYKYGHFEKELMKYLFDQNFDDIFKQLSSCLIFRDIFFDKMILCDCERINMKNNDASFRHMECIDFNQYIEDQFIVIDEYRKKQLHERIETIKSDKVKKAYKELEDCLNINHLFEVARNYLRMNVQEEKEYFSRIEDESTSDIMKFLNCIDLCDEESCIIRLGNSTNYFYKSTSLLIKEYFRNFYEREFQLFSPVNLKNKIKPTPDKMPNTRNVLYFDQYYLAGFIKIEKYK